ncbi:E3 ubiquitin-protein ligase MSL2b [Sardina pilchardus]|uniref:E3 ubiquitin-protein ligase MSL2b n=1 Tax=Sardina pilchardus TaxID=27697 RepID=UPI002E1130B0
MNPVNATTLYVSACRSVLQCDPRDPQALAELYKLLPFFRQSLSCLACGNLLQDPIAPTNSSCQHYVCKACKGKKMMMKPSCSWCKDYEQFAENKQLCILVDCYRKLCEYIAGSPLAPHIANAVGESPDLLAMLNDGLSLIEDSPTEESDVALLLNLSRLSPAPSTSERHPDEVQPPHPPASEGCEQPLSPLEVNGLQGCNGLANVDELSVSLPSPAGGVQLTVDIEGPMKRDKFEGKLDVSEAVAAAGDELSPSSMDMCGFGEEIKHSGGTLLLSVEEVLRTLEPEPLTQEDCGTILQASQDSSGNLNGPFVCSANSSTNTTSTDSPRPLPSLPLNSSEALAPQHPNSQHQHSHPSSGMSCSAVTPRVPRSSRKRSRSESDSEKIQPLPISSIIPLGASAPVVIKSESKVPSVMPHMASVPNGGGLSKVGKTLVVSNNKNVKKSQDHHGPKKAYAKAKQGTPKSKDKTKERTSSSTSIPGSPTKVVYKKPQEKKGCKCGRATQNPSVLTCRGQRCPCYSNRKACLDCICRGCQNSYMANGEKKLEAFAVPEKALEQTRLTLGINVTSIQVRNPSASPASGVLNVTSTAGSPVPSFLSAGSHDDKGFDEALDMRFDC